MTGVAPPLVCLTNVYVLGNMPDRKTPSCGNTCSTCSASSAARRRSKSATSAPAAIGWSGCSTGTRPFPESPDRCRAASRIPNSRSSRRSGTWQRPATPRWRSSSPRLQNGFSLLGGYTLADRQRQRHPHAQRRHAVSAGQLLPRVRVGLVDLRRAAPVRLVGALRAAPWRRQALSLRRSRRGAARRLADQRDHLDLERLSEKRDRGHRSVEHRRGAGPARCDRPAVELPSSERTVQRWFNTNARHAASRHVGERRPEHGDGTRHHQRRCVAHPEFPDRPELASVPFEAFNALNHPIWK